MSFRKFNINLTYFTQFNIKKAVANYFTQNNWKDEEIIRNKSKCNKSKITTVQSNIYTSVRKTLVLV